METFNDLLKKTIPLFQGLRQPNSYGLRHVRPLMPNRVKFIFNPEDMQVIYPGIYFVVPDWFSTPEFEILEGAILKAFEENPADPTDVVLDIPLWLARKLSGQKRTSPFLNTFRFSHNRLFMRSCDCVWVDPKKELTWTSIANPEYGEVFPLTTSILMLQCLVSLSSLYGGPKLDTRERVAALDFERILRILPANIVPELSITKMGKVSLKLGGITIDDFESIDAVNTLNMMLGSFLRSDTNLNDYMDTI